MLAKIAALLAQVNAICGFMPSQSNRQLQKKFWTFGLHDSAVFSRDQRRGNHVGALLITTIGSVPASSSNELHMRSLV